MQRAAIAVWFKRHSIYVLICNYISSLLNISLKRYCIYYLRPLQKYDLKNSNWKILGVSKTFKLDLMEEDYSELKKSAISLNHSKSNTSFLDFFNKSILGFTDSPPKHDLHISKLQPKNIDEEKDLDFTKKKGKTQKIFSDDFEKHSEIRTLIETDLTNILTVTNEGIVDEIKEEKNNEIKEQKLTEITDAQKFYAESLMRIKKVNQDFILSPKNRFPISIADKLKKNKSSKENVFGP